MQNVVIKIISISLAIFATSCSNFKFPGAYVFSVTQGNYVDGEMVEQLEKGMTRRQVQFVLGTPLVENTFEADRWDYYYEVKRGEKPLRKYHFTVFFDQDLLSHWEGDYAPKPKSRNTNSENSETPEDVEDLDKKKF